MNDLTQFQRVSFEKERLKVLENLSLKPVTVLAFTEKGSRLIFTVERVENQNIFLLPSANQNLNQQEASISEQEFPTQTENVQLVFGFNDGQYLVQSTITPYTVSSFLVPFTQDVFRLQRRNNFRVDIPKSSAIVFTMISIGANKKPNGVDLSLLDLSAGGFKAVWPTSENLIVPQEGEIVTGVLKAPEGKSLPLSGCIKTIFRDRKSTSVGVSFRNLSMPDEQTLLFICMKLLRQHSSGL